MLQYISNMKLILIGAIENAVFPFFVFALLMDRPQSLIEIINIDEEKIHQGCFQSTEQRL